jgi:hypothetical protein
MKIKNQQNIIKLDPAVINQKEFFDKTTFDNMEIEKYIFDGQEEGTLGFSYKIVPHRDIKDPFREINKQFLKYYIDDNRIYCYGYCYSKFFKLENFVEYQKLINQAFDYIKAYKKLIETN